ncbi:MAG: hypothetical protein HDR28_03535, partial [Lachnospiraceae bacterium]|nr:hypothetical protein [Lachnospiraceae bacterium]
NAVSQLLYGNTPLKGVGDAFKRGGLTGAATAGINNIAGTLGIGGTGRRTSREAEDTADSREV